MKSEVSRGRVRPLFYRGSAPVTPQPTAYS